MNCVNLQCCDFYDPQRPTERPSSKIYTVFSTRRQSNGSFFFMKIVRRKLLGRSRSRPVFIYLNVVGENQYGKYSFFYRNVPSHHRTDRISKINRCICMLIKHKFYYFHSISYDILFHISIRLKNGWQIARVHTAVALFLFDYTICIRRFLRRWCATSIEMNTTIITDVFTLFVHKCFEAPQVESI